MKSAIFITIFFLLAKPVMPVLEYAVKYDYIVAELCENKAKPEMHCNGKCHLMKELAKASETEKPQSEKKNTHHETEVLFFQESENVTFFTAIAVIVSKPSTGYTNLYSHTGSASIFHPPIFIG